MCMRECIYGVVCHSGVMLSIAIAWFKSYILNYRILELMIPTNSNGLVQVGLCTESQSAKFGTISASYYYALI